MNKQFRSVMYVRGGAILMLLQARWPAMSDEAWEASDVLGASMRKVLKAGGFKEALAQMKDDRIISEGHSGGDMERIVIWSTHEPSLTELNGVLYAIQNGYTIPSAFEYQQEPSLIDKETMK